jgi:hypothetical protein
MNWIVNADLPTPVVLIPRDKKKGLARVTVIRVKNLDPMKKVYVCGSVFRLVIPCGVY